MTFWIDPLKLQKHKFLPLLFWMITFLNVLFVVGCRGKEKKKSSCHIKRTPSRSICQL